MKTLPQMDSAVVDLLGEVYLQKNRKAFHKDWCKTGFVFYREVHAASLVPQEKLAEETGALAQDGVML